MRFRTNIFFDEFGGSAKSRPKIAKIRDFGRQMVSACYFGEGSAAEAVRRGGENGGFFKNC